MLAVVASDGPKQGTETYRVDERLNWRVSTDMALDAGFAQGLVVSQNLDITSGVLWVQPSRQTEAGIEGGVDRADDIPTGAPVFGALGDSDADGMLDGRIVGASRVPIDFLFVPGGPIVMTRTIVTDIPLSARVGGLLELASVANLSLILGPPPGLSEPSPEPSPEAAAYVARMLPAWADEFSNRAAHAASRLAAIDAPEATLASELAEALAAALPQAADRDAYAAAVAEGLGRLETALPMLRQTFAELTSTAATQTNSHASQ